MNNAERAQKAFENNFELTTMITELGKEREDLLRGLTTSANIREDAMRLSKIDSLLETAKQIKRILKTSRREFLRRVN